MVLWSPPTYPNGPITDYTVFYKEGNTSQTPPISSNGFRSMKSDGASLNITGLDPYTDYTIHVQAVISAQELENEESVIEDLLGAIDEEIVARTNGTTPDQPVMIDGMPLAGPTATTFQITIPRTLDKVDTGKVL